MLDRFARLVNPWLLRIEHVGFGGYYWVTDQCEIATDVMFKSRAALAAVMPDLIEHSLTSSFRRGRAPLPRSQALWPLSW